MNFDPKDDITVFLWPFRILKAVVNIQSKSQIDIFKWCKQSVKSVRCNFTNMWWNTLSLLQHCHKRFNPYTMYTVYIKENERYNAYMFQCFILTCFNAFNKLTSFITCWLRFWNAVEMNQWYIYRQKTSAEKSPNPSSTCTHHLVIATHCKLLLWYNFDSKSFTGTFGECYFHLPTRTSVK